jgi:thymidine phosphorylase
LPQRGRPAINEVYLAQLARWLFDRTVRLAGLGAGRRYISARKIAEMYAPIIHPLLTKSAGTVKKWMPRQSVEHRSILEAASKAADDAIDFDVSLSGTKKIGERVEKEEPLPFVHSRTDQALLSVPPILQEAIEIE